MPTPAYGAATGKLLCHPDAGENSPAEFVKLYAEPHKNFGERGFPYTVREG